jgi:hypothetical protein
MVEASEEGQGPPGGVEPMVVMMMMMVVVVVVMYLCFSYVPSRFGSGFQFFYLYLAWNQTPRYLDGQAEG